MKTALLAVAIAVALCAPADAKEYWGFANGATMKTSDEIDLFNLTLAECGDLARRHAGTVSIPSTNFWRPGNELHFDTANADRLLGVCLRGRGYKVLKSDAL